MIYRAARNGVAAAVGLWAFAYTAEVTSRVEHRLICGHWPHWTLVGQCSMCVTTKGARLRRDEIDALHRDGARLP